jgi:chromosome partitioning protein
MPVVVLGSSKGGVSKSATSIALAVSFARLGHKVACVDADPNAALMAWHRNAPELGIDASAEVSEDAIVSHIHEKSKKFDIVIVDTGGWMNQTGVFSFGAADCVLIPVMPDRNSVIEARRTAKKVESVAQIARRDIVYRVVLSRWTPRGLLERATLSDLETTGLPHLRQHVPNLTALGKASFSGELPKDGAIVDAMNNIIAELAELGVIGKGRGR